MILLSICVPTYNRTNELRFLNDSFFADILGKFGHLIEIIVCDNSSESVSNLNKSNLDIRVKYFWNEKNIKFAGNFIKCLDEASGEYVWIISDDDMLLVDNFIKFFDNLIVNRHKNIDCYMIPYSTHFPYGDNVISNTSNDWNCENFTNAKNLVSNSKVPFILFSTCIIRRNTDKLDVLKNEYIENAYVQVIAFLSMLKEESKIDFFEDVIIEYQPGYLGQTISVVEMAESLCEVRKYLENQFNIRPNYREDYKGWLLWLFHHRGGFYYLHNGDKDRLPMAKKIFKWYSHKSLILIFLIFLPKIIVRPIYLLYKIFSDTKAYSHFSINELINRYRCYKSFINKLDIDIERVINK